MSGPAKLTAAKAEKCRKCGHDVHIHFAQGEGDWGGVSGCASDECSCTNVPTHHGYYTTPQGRAALAKLDAAPGAERGQE